MSILPPSNWHTHTDAVPTARVPSRDVIPHPRPGDQPNPLPAAGPDIQPLVIADLQDRYELGKARYGTGLKAFNGRNGLRDLYEELVDAIMYVRQVMEEDTSVMDEGCTCDRKPKRAHKIACPLYTKDPNHDHHGRARTAALRDLIECYPGHYKVLYDMHLNQLRDEAASSDGSRT